MGELRLPGIATGIDTTSLIKQLMTVQGRRLATYQVKQRNYDAQTSAIETLRSQIGSLRNSAGSLSDADDMEVYSVSTSDSDILTISASSDANPGSHSIEVDQLATAETWIQDVSSFSYKTDYVGGGDFIYSYDNKERVIAAVDGETTLQDFVNLINNDQDNPGVTASLLYQGDKYHLMLTGQETGEDYQISVNSVSTEVWQADSNFTKDEEAAGLATKITELEQFSGTLGASDKITITGKNHYGTALADTELAITSETTIGHVIDQINKHFDGIATATLENGQICLTDNISGASGVEIGLSFTGDATLTMPTMAVSSEGGGTAESLALIDSSSFIQTQNAQSSKIKIDGYPTAATNEVQTLSIGSGVPTTGTFKLTLNGETTSTIQYNATAADIQSALESLTSVEVGDVVCSGSDLPAGDISMTFGGSLAGMNVTNITVSETGTMDAGVVSVAETTKGNSGWLHRNGNNINNAISGITLNLNDVTAVDESVKITVSRNSGSISKKIQSLVAAYNGTIEEIKNNTEYDSETKSMGILSNDVAISYLKSWVRDPFSGMLGGFVDTIDSYVQASDIGITLDGAGMLEFDSDVFNDAISDDYKGVLNVLGAAKSGNSDSSMVQFYDASDKYTTAGTYHVKVEVDSNDEIISAQIKLSTESTYRDAASFSGNTINFDSTFDDDGNPLYAEHSLQLTANLTEGVYGTDETPVIVRVRQGAAGALEDMLDKILDIGGQLDTSADIMEDKDRIISDKIEKEEARLDKVEQRLIEKYARLEKTLTQLNQQMGAVNAMMGS